LAEVVYNSQTLKEVQKNIIQSINHILNHDLVCEHPAAANFVGTVERNMQEMKEEFNKVVLSTCGSNIGKDNGCVSLHIKIRRRCKWKNNTRVLLDSEIS
jgi:hypothetical protein